MVKVWSEHAIDLRAVDLGEYTTVTNRFFNDSFFFMHGQLYRDGYALSGYSLNDSSYRYILAGNRIEATAQGVITGGVVTGFSSALEGPLGPDVIWGMEDLSIAAVEFYAALRATDPGVFRDLTAQALSGNDQFDLSDCNDSAFGAAGSDRMSGNRGADTLCGGIGNDTLYGGLGYDELCGGCGIDHLYGEGGHDRFVFRAPLKSGVDRIWNFASGDDTIMLEDAVFQSLAKGTLRPRAFEVSTDGQAHFATTRIIFNSTDQTLSYDADGAGGAAATMFAKLAVSGPYSSVTVNADDFLIV